jgi:hypothetical protein
MAAPMAADLAALFSYEFTQTATVPTVNGKAYPVIVGDEVASEQDAYGGPESIFPQQVHFQTAQLASMEPGTLFALTSLLGVQQKECVSAVISEDGSELIVTCRNA